MVRIRTGRCSCVTLCLQLFWVFAISATEPTIKGGGQTTHALHGQTVQLCRDREGRFPQAVFSLHACSKCLDYLLRDKGPGQFHINMSHHFALLQSRDTGRFLLAEPGNQSAMEIVCQTLSSQDCQDWKACCQSATACCQKQMDSSQTSSRGNNGSGDDDSANGDGCPMTWDGFSCVDKTAPGEAAVIQCPSFITRFTKENNGKASRQCWSNSTWYTNSLGLEWTDYSSCHQAQDHQTLLTLKLVFKGISLVFLVPAIAIFLLFRALRTQLRIKLHINLFISLVLTALFSLLWEVLVSRDLLVTDQSHVFIKTHQEACKFLNITSRCMLMTTFFWMFCEGFYLTWLMIQSFTHLSSLRPFVIFAWGTPVSFSVIYVAVRASSHDDRQCWVTSAGGVEWILNGPTVACISVNFLFLVAIMRVMLCQLRSHNEDQSMVLRRSLRALLILIPLFGVQQFCILYRPLPSAPGFYVYEVVSAAVNHLQGAVVALIFCFFNGEVQGHLKDLYRRLLYKLRGQRQQSRQSVSMASSFQHRSHRPSLASIDTTASVILAPVRLTATKDHSKDRNGDGDDGGVRVSRSCRFRVLRLEDDIAEHSPEPDNSSISNSQYASAVEKNTDKNDLTHSSTSDQDEGESSERTLQNDFKTYISGQETIEGKKRQSAFVSKLSSTRRVLGMKTTKRDGQISDTHVLSRRVNAAAGQCNPSIIISQYEHEVASSAVAPPIGASDETMNVCSEARDQSILTETAKCNVTVPGTNAFIHAPYEYRSSAASVDDGASSKDSVCDEDSDTWQLVHASVRDNSPISCHRKKPKHIHQHEVTSKLGRHSLKGQPFEACVRHVHRFRSVPDDTRHLCSDAESLQGSDSSASFTTFLPNEPHSDDTSMTRMDDHVIYVSSLSADGDDMESQEDVDSEPSEGLCFVNIAFEDN